MKIGLITDTHLPGRIRTLEELGPLPEKFLKSVDLILHGGDLTSPIVLDWCEQYAPVLCSTGNNDPGLSLAAWGRLHACRRRESGR